MTIKRISDGVQSWCFKEGDNRYLGDGQILIANGGIVSAVQFGFNHEEIVEFCGATKNHQLLGGWHFVCSTGQVVEVFYRGYVGLFKGEYFADNESDFKERFDRYEGPERVSKYRWKKRAIDRYSQPQREIMPDEGCMFDAIKCFADLRNEVFVREFVGAEESDCVNVKTDVYVLKFEGVFKRCNEEDFNQNFELSE